jgi:hypothetical protein
MNRIIKYIIVKAFHSFVICYVRFTFENTGEIIITNPENPPLKFNFEFLTPDLIVQTAIKYNVLFKEVKSFRKK